MTTQNNKEFDIDDTFIEMGGVFRCCISCVADEYKGKQVTLGDKSRCKYCGQSFTLIMVPPEMETCYPDQITKVTPVWKPDWQIEQYEHATKR